MRRLSIVALLIGLSVVFYWKLVLTTEYTWLDSPDMSFLEMPRFQFQAQQWHKLRAPLWDPHHWMGQPFLGQITGAADPLNWPVFLFGFREGKIRQDVVHWHFVLGHALAAALMFWLCRDRGRSMAASVIAGCVFSFGGYLGTSDWPQVLHGCLWTPAVLLYLLRAMEGRDSTVSAAMAGVACGMSWLSGHHQAPYYLSLLLVGIWGWAIVREPRAKAVRGALVSLSFTGLVGALQIIPGWEYGRLAIRWAGAAEPLRWWEKVPAFVHEQYTFRLQDLAGTIVPGAHLHTNPYIGAVPLALAIYGVARYWREPGVRLVAALLAIAVFFSVAAHNPAYGVLYGLVTWFDKARVPARIIFLFGAAAAVLAAYGWDALRQEASKWNVWPVAGIAAALAALGAVLQRDALAVPAVTLGVFAALVGAMGRGAIGSVAANAILVLLVLFELAHVRDFSSRLAPGYKSDWASIWRHDDIAEYLKAQKGPVRVSIDDPEVAYNFGDWHGIDMTIGYTATAPYNVAMLEWHKPETQDVLAVTHTVGRQPQDARDEEVFRGATGLKVFRRHGVLDRARLVHQAIQANTLGELRVRLHAGDGRNAAIFVGPLPALEQCGDQGEVEWLERQPSTFLLRATTTCRALLVVADTWFPGWEAMVDGRSAPVLEVYGAVRGVTLTAGQHEIRMRYRPWTVRAGAALTALGLVLAAGLWAGAKIRNTAPSRD
ncbi:MAG: YfhO family protein [Bryobacterales bacterium]|nr:YfhO family protein [Bryobacterales bacterium]